MKKKKRCFYALCTPRDWPAMREQLSEKDNLLHTKISTFRNRRSDVCMDLGNQLFKAHKEMESVEGERSACYERNTRKSSVAGHYYCHRCFESSRLVVC